MISFQKGITIFLISVFLISCSSLTQTKPSDPFQGPYPSSFRVIQESNPILTKNLLFDYRSNKNRFSIKARRLLKEKKSYQSPRWSDLGNVTDRLNSPELINYYEKRRFSYAPWRTIPFYLQNYDSNILSCARYVFKNNRGDCSYTTGFTIYCLKKEGYNAFEMRVKPKSPKYNYRRIMG
jgi:hypothetical protein